MYFKDKTESEMNKTFLSMETASTGFELGSIVENPIISNKAVVYEGSGMENKNSENHS